MVKILLCAKMNNSNEYTILKLYVFSIIQLNIKKCYLLYLMSRLVVATVKNNLLAGKYDSRKRLNE